MVRAPARTRPEEVYMAFSSSGLGCAGLPRAVRTVEARRPLLVALVGRRCFHINKYERNEQWNGKTEISKRF